MDYLAANIGFLIVKLSNSFLENIDNNEIAFNTLRNNMYSCPT